MLAEVNKVTFFGTAGSSVVGLGVDSVVAVDVDEVHGHSGFLRAPRMHREHPDPIQMEDCVVWCNSPDYTQTESNSSNINDPKTYDSP